MVVFFLLYQHPIYEIIFVIENSDDSRQDESQLEKNVIRVNNSIYKVHSQGSATAYDHVTNKWDLFPGWS